MTAATRSPAAASPRASQLAASPVPQRETPLSALPLTPRAATYSPRAVAAGARVNYAQELDSGASLLSSQTVAGGAPPTTPIAESVKVRRLL